MYSGLGDLLIMLLKAKREREERKRCSKDRKERGEGRKGGRNEGHRFMSVLICESSVWHRSDDCALYRVRQKFDS